MENKICPLMSTAATEKGTWYCEKENCAWWIEAVFSEGLCALVSISISLMEEEEEKEEEEPENSLSDYDGPF